MLLAEITDVYEFNGTRLIVPSPGADAEAVRKANAHRFGDLASAILKGPETRGTERVWTFKPNPGARG